MDDFFSTHISNNCDKTICYEKGAAYVEKVFVKVFQWYISCLFTANSRVTMIRSVGGDNVVHSVSFKNGCSRLPI